MHARGLLLDIGGVVLLGAVKLVGRLAERHRPMAAVLDQLGEVGGPQDERWQQMLRAELTEREYWQLLADSLGASIGETWTTRDLIHRLYTETPRDVWLNEPVVALMTDARAAGIPLGALTNDLLEFHGEQWASEQDFLALFQVIVDGSTTGVLKPDPRAFALGVDAIGLPAHEIVYLDDMPHNVDAGAAAGLQAVPVSYEAPEAAVGIARERLGLRD